MNCPNCREPFPDFVRHCPACQFDVGFPNVRIAESPEEYDALLVRVKNAQISVRARKCENVLDNFGQAVLQSKAVICRGIGQVQTLISDEYQLYPSFYQQVKGDARLPENNEWDRGRPAVDGVLFPLYHEEIRFGSLTLSALSERALQSTYGQCAIVLKDAMIMHRSTVFEENPFLFCKRHNVVAGDKAPAGYRATWENRHLLAMAKLHSRIHPKTQPDEYPSIILVEQADGQDDFIEVHIYGSIHRSAIERIIIPRPKKKAESVIVRSLRQKLNSISIPLEEVA